MKPNENNFLSKRSLPGKRNGVSYRQTEWKNYGNIFKYHLFSVNEMREMKAHTRTHTHTHADSNLSWNTHVTKLYAKLCSRLYLFNQVKQLLPLHAWKLYFSGMVQPIIDYGYYMGKLWTWFADESSRDDETICTCNFECKTPATDFNCDTVSYSRMAANWRSDVLFHFHSNV